MSLPEASSPAPASLFSNRWVQLSAGVVSMVAVTNFQYGWTQFIPELQRAHGWGRDQVANALSIFFISAQTWLVPVEGYLAERFGPRRLLLLGGVLAALAWVIIADTSSLTVLYLAQVACGCGSGIVYGISMGSALKWFPDRRGLAAGLTAAAFGAGSAATVLPIEWTIAVHGHAQALFWFGLGQGALVVFAGLMMRFPRPGELPPLVQPKVLQSGRDYTPSEMLRAPSFWLVYAMMTVGAVPGLLMLVQIKPMAYDFGVAEMPVQLFGITMYAYAFAMMIDRIMGGLTRPVFGWVSDHVGREVAIFLAFSLEGVALLVLILNAHDPYMFVLMSGLAFFGWGAVFSLFPAVNGDMFGRKFATTNYGLLYTAKGTATLLVSLCNYVQVQTNDWVPIFWIMIAFDWLAALLALFVLRPLRQRLARGEVPMAMAAEKVAAK